MTSSDLGQLALLSIKKPAEAAQFLLNMRLDSQTLWTGLFLVAVSNTLLFSISNMMVPGPSPIPGLFNNPMIYFLFVTGGLVLTVYALFWVGRGLGGAGGLYDVMVLIVWMQALRVVVQGATLVLLLTMPALSALLVLAAAVIGIYMLVHFIDQAHGFGSVGRAVGVLIASVLAIVLGLSLLLSLSGFPIGGVPGYV
ncbi:MAG: YIP1 family protein [Sedimentitalea sp.]